MNRAENCRELLRKVRKNAQQALRAHNAPAIPIHKPTGEGTRRSDVLNQLLDLPGRSGCHPMLLETLPAKNRPALCWPEGHCSFFPALRTDRSGLRPLAAARCRLIPLRLAGLAPLRIIPEMLIGEESLFSCREDEILTAVHALQGSILIFRIFRHGFESPPEIPRVSTCR